MPDVVMGFYFYPRGGSAQVARSLCTALGSGTWNTLLLSGSLGDPTAQSNAECFFGDLPCRSLDYTPAWSAFGEGADPMAGPVPMHGSFERKPDVPDRILFDLDDDTFERQVANWAELLSSSTAGAPDLLHLHHLTPIHEAARRLWPDVPVLTHLHGTELKMLALAQGPSAADVAGPYTDQWVDRMRRWATDSAHLIVVSDQDAELAEQLLAVDRSIVSVIPNGVDIDLFTPNRPTPAERMRKWKRWLVDDPKGWRPGFGEGSIGYRSDDLAAFVDQGEPVPVVVFAGRFMQFKRVWQLVEAHHAMRTETGRRSVLVIVGGYPGEWEGEHPYDTAQRLGADDVVLLGWRNHTELAEILGCCDVFGAPAVDEPFGLVYLEAMAAGLPPIATNTGGPASFINVEPNRPTGWLVAPDDVEAITGALTEAVTDPTLRHRRGENAAAFVREYYSWTAAADSIASLYTKVSNLPTIS